MPRSIFVTNSTSRMDGRPAASPGAAQGSAGAPIIAFAFACPLIAVVSFALAAALAIAPFAPLQAQQVNRSSRGMVSAGQPLAAQAGADMLEQGGNAVDAAVAAAFALAVVEPSMSGLGGRAQILIRTPDGEYHGIDATTQAPATYDPDTAPQAGYGYPTIGVPGVPAGLLKAHAEFGSLPLAAVMAPAIRLAAQGFTMLPGEARRHQGSVEQLAEFEGSRQYFLRPDGSAHEGGDRFVQSDLAATLRAIASGGHDAFYRGPIAERMVADLQANGAAVTMQSLADYQAEASRIVRGEYRGSELIGLWIPSFGAITIHALQLLGTVDLTQASEAEWAAAVAEALRVAYLERPNQADWSDAERLMSQEWANERSAMMRLPVGMRMGGLPVPAPQSAIPRAGSDDGAAPPAFTPPPAWTAEPGHTTHLTAADSQGGMVSLTQSLGPTMGSKVAAPGLGFLYAATLGGYLGRMEPGQRAGSHISPFMVAAGGEPELALGAAGGGRIPTAIVAVVSRVIDQGMPIGEALRAPRVVPATGSAFEAGDANARPEVDLETNTGLGFDDQAVRDFEALGFTARLTPRPAAFGRVHAVWRDHDSGEWVGAADPDWEGAAIAPPAASFDRILRGGRVLDGTGNPWFSADVGITGDRVAAIGNLSGAEADEVIDVAGYYVTPGFIDSHSHSGPGLASEGLSHARPLLAQGITTVFINPDGGGEVDLAEQRTDLMEHGLGVNVAQLVPHGAVLSAVMGSENRLATPAELEQMRGLVRTGMRVGAFGLSSGPFYVPGSYSDTHELVELGKVAGEFGGAYTSHVRDESNYTIGVVAALDEVITVAREAGIPGVHTHIKVLGPPVWGFSQALVHRVEQARVAGVEVYADQYPYPASATGLSAALLPAWSMAGGNDSLMARFDRPTDMTRIRAEMVENLARRGGADRIQFRRVTFDESLEGKLLSDVASDWGLDPLDAAIRLFREGRPSIVSFNMHEDDIRRLMDQPWTMTASDGDLVPWMEGVPHPRSYGAFTRKLETYVREEGVVSIEAAVRSMTGLPAQVFRVKDRGVLREGAMADIAVFRLEDLHENATFTEPHQLSDGMHWLFVNGVPVIRAGVFNDARQGRILNR